MNIRPDSPPLVIVWCDRKKILSLWLFCISTEHGCLLFLNKVFLVQPQHESTSFTDECSWSLSSTYRLIWKLFVVKMMLVLDISGSLKILCCSRHSIFIIWGRNNTQLHQIAAFVLGYGRNLHIVARRMRMQMTTAGLCSSEDPLTSIYKATFFVAGIYAKYGRNRNHQML